MAKSSEYAKLFASQDFWRAASRGLLFLPPSPGLGYVTQTVSALLAAAIGIALLASFGGSPTALRYLKNATAWAVIILLPDFRNLGRDPDGAIMETILAQGFILVPAFTWFGVFCLIRMGIDKLIKGRAGRKAARLKRKNAAKRGKLEAKFKAAAGKSGVSEINAILDESKRTPEGADLTTACIQDCLIDAVKRKALPIAEALVARDRHFFKSDSQGVTVSGFLIEAGRRDDLFRLIEKTPEKGRAMSHALREAIVRGKVDFARALLEAGAPVEGADDGKGPPLIAAVKAGKAEIVRLLIEKGASADAENDKGETALALCHGYDDGGEIAMLLLEAGANAKVFDRSGNTPLMEAIKHGHPDVVKALLAAGADTDMQDNDGYTPLMHAVAIGDLDAARLLADRGEKSIAVKNKNGKTALDIARKKGKQEIVQILFDHGATREFVLKEFSALDDASRKEVDQIVKLFARSLDAKYIVPEIQKQGFDFVEENNAGAMFKSRSGILMIKMGSGYRITSASYGRNGAGMSGVVYLVEWQGSNVGRPLFTGTTGLEGKNVEEPFALLGAADIVVFPSGADEGYANSRRYHEEKFRRGLASCEVSYFLSRANDRASYDHLIVQTGVYKDMAATKLNSPHDKEVFSACFPDVDLESDWSAVLGKGSCFGNYAPEGYEISDFRIFDELVGEIIDGYYKRDLVLRK